MATDKGTARLAIIDRINKLFATSRDKAVTVHEAETFMLKAQQMMAEHRIQEHEVVGPGTRAPLSGTQRKIFEALVQDGMILTTWRKNLCATIAENFGCAAILSGTIDHPEPRLTVVGASENLEVVGRVFQFALDVGEQGMKDHLKVLGPRTQDQIREIRYQWGNGYAIGIADKFKAQVAQEPGVALMVIEDQDSIGQFLDSIGATKDPAAVYRGKDQTLHFQVGYVTGRLSPTGIEIPIEQEARS